MATFQQTPKYCVTFGTKSAVDYKQASDGPGLRRVMQTLRKATAPRKRCLFVIVYRDNRMIYRCWRGERGHNAMRDWGLLYE
jgi:hypothetical protein